MRRRTPVRTLAITIALALSAASAVRAEEAQRIHLRGLLDLVVHNDNHAADLVRFSEDASPLESQRLRLFADGNVSGNVDVFTQVIFAQNEIVLDGAYALITPWRERDLHVMAGKIPWPIGTWAPRTYSNKNPLIVSPLMYQYHTSLRWDATPPNVDALLAAAGTGWEGADYGSGPGMPGMPIVDDYGWDFGVVGLGSVSKLEFSAGLTNSAPGWGSPGEDANDGKAVMGRLGFVPTAGLRFGVSAAQGAYLGEWVRYAMAPGKTEADYPQTLVMGDFSYEHGHFDLRAEGFANAWETPHVGTLRSQGGYAEGRYGFDNGLWLAVRGEAMRFSDVTSGAITRPWDDEVDRFDSGVGYRIARGAALKANWQRMRQHASDGMQTYDLFAGQLSLEF